MPSFSDSSRVDGGEMKLYLNVPEGPSAFPGIVVIHHGPGVDQFVREIVDRLAGEGYAAIAPDLFHRITDSMLADGSSRRDHLSDPEIVADLNATVEYLGRQPSVAGDRLGITGFCMGGRVVWLGAAATPHFSAAVPYYGGGIMVPWGKADQSPFQRSQGINCPMMFHFGEIDGNPSQADMARMDADLTRLGKEHQFFTYPGADHAFMNDLGEKYDRAAAEVSWPRTLEFFSQHLKRVAIK